MTTTRRQLIQVIITAAAVISGPAISAQKSETRAMYAAPGTVVYENAQGGSCDGFKATSEKVAAGWPVTILKTVVCADAEYVFISRVWDGRTLYAWYRKKDLIET